MKKIKFLFTAAVVVASSYMVTVNSEQNSSNYFSEDDNIAFAEGGGQVNCRPVTNWSCYPNVYVTLYDYIYVM